MDDKMGVSLVICHSDKGKVALDNISGVLADFRIVERNEVLQPRLVEPTQKPRKRRRS